MSGNVPIRGTFDSSKIKFLLSTIIGGVKYILIVVFYDTSGGIPGQYELLFTPCVFLNGVNLTYNDIFASSLPINSGEYGSRDPAQNIQYNGNNFPIKFIVPAVCLRNQDKIVVDTPDGPLFMFYTTLSGQSDSGMVLSITSSSINFIPEDPTASFYNQDPVFFAGYPYVIDFDSQDPSVSFPFRVLRAQTQQDQEGKLIQSSYCATSGAFSDFAKAFLCNNDLSNTNPENQNYFLDRATQSGSPTDTIYIDNSGIVNVTATIVMIPIQFYTANIKVNGELSAAPAGCISVGNKDQVMDNFFYYWMSGYTQYTNAKTLDKYSPMISTSTPGFVGEGSASPVSIQSWTTKEECQRGYFYKYCDIGQTCGDCFGQCALGPCKINPQFTSANVVGQKPYLCGVPPITPKKFWEKYKNWILGIGIGLAVLVLLIAIFGKLLISARKKDRENNMNQGTSVGSSTIINYQ